MLSVSEAERLHDAADEAQAAAVEIMDNLHRYEELDETDREFASMAMPDLLVKFRAASKSLRAA